MGLQKSRDLQLALPAPQPWNSWVSILYCSKHQLVHQTSLVFFSDGETPVSLELMINSCYLKMWLSAALASGQPHFEFAQWLRSEEVKVKLLSCVWEFATAWTVVSQAPLSVGYSRQEYWNGLRHKGKFKFSKLLSGHLFEYTVKQERKKKSVYWKSKHLYQSTCLICKDFKYFHGHSAQGNDVTSHWESVKVNIKVKWTVPAKTHLEEDGHFGRQKTFLLRIATNKVFQVWFQKLLFKMSLKQLFLEVPFSMELKNFYNRDETCLI